MTRTKKLFSMAVALTLLTFFACHAFAEETTPDTTLYRTATTFKVKANPELDVTATFGPDGSLVSLESCEPLKKNCKKIENWNKSSNELKQLYICVPLKNKQNLGGTEVTLKEQSYDCQPLTAIEATGQVMLKAGDNTSCPIFYNKRWHDPCN